MLRSLAPSVLVLALLGASGCYASVGPTLGYDFATQRTLLGLEASGASFTVAHVRALNNGTAIPAPVRQPPPLPLPPTLSPISRTESAPHPVAALRAPPLWPHSTWEQPQRTRPPVAPVGPWNARTYLLWEPGVPLVDLNRTRDAFGFATVGGSIGVRIEHYAVGDPRPSLTGGAWFGGAKTLSPRDYEKPCDATDSRTYVAVLLGFRGAELYLAAKVGRLVVLELQPCGSG